jgi:hypothetical protein
MDYGISPLKMVKFSNLKARALARALQFENLFNYREWRNMVILW